jgi:hypothetical protein
MFNANNDIATQFFLNLFKKKTGGKLLIITMIEEEATECTNNNTF